MAEPTVDAALHAVWELNRRLRDDGERIASAAGQSHARRLVLQSSRDGSTVPDIARGLRLQRQSVQRVADDLVRDGLASYETNPRHRRSRLLRTTTAGDDVLARVAARHDAWVTEIAELDVDLDWTELRRTLESLLTALDARRDREGESGRHDS